MYAIFLQEGNHTVNRAEVLWNDIGAVDAETKGDLHVRHERHDVIGVEHACLHEVHILGKVAFGADRGQNLQYLFSHTTHILLAVHLFLIEETVNLTIGIALQLLQAMISRGNHVLGQHLTDA